MFLNGKIVNMLSSIEHNIIRVPCTQMKSILDACDQQDVWQHCIKNRHGCLGNHSEIVVSGHRAIHNCRRKLYRAKKKPRVFKNKKPYH